MVRPPVARPPMADSETTPVARAVPARGLLAAASVAVAQQALDVDEAELRAAEGTVEWVNFTGVVR